MKSDEGVLPVLVLLQGWACFGVVLGNLGFPDVPLHTPVHTEALGTLAQGSLSLPDWYLLKKS